MVEWVQTRGAMITYESGACRLLCTPQSCHFDPQCCGPCWAGLGEEAAQWAQRGPADRWEWLSTALCACSRYPRLFDKDQNDWLAELGDASLREYWAGEPWWRLPIRRFPLPRFWGLWLEVFWRPCSPVLPRCLQSWQLAVEAAWSALELVSDSRPHDSPRCARSSGNYSIQSRSCPQPISGERA